MLIAGALGSFSFGSQLRLSPIVAHYPSLNAPKFMWWATWMALCKPIGAMGLVLNAISTAELSLSQRNFFDFNWFHTRILMDSHSTDAKTKSALWYTRVAGSWGCCQCFYPGKKPFPLLLQAFTVYAVIQHAETWCGQSGIRCKVP